MVVEGGSYTANGSGSPAIYVTADITVSDAALSASNSEAVVIEGGNSVTLNGVELKDWRVRHCDLVKGGVLEFDMESHGED